MVNVCLIAIILETLSIKFKAASYHLIDPTFIGVVGLFIYVGCHVSYAFSHSEKKVMRKALIFEKKYYLCAFYSDERKIDYI